MAARVKTAEDLTAKACRTLRRMIVEGRLQPRQRLSHRSLSKDLGIGRSPVRDRLLQHEAEGLIDHGAVYDAVRRRDAKAAHVSWARQEVPEHHASLAETGR